jgi:hypothetical protein
MPIATYATIMKLLRQVFSVEFMQRLYNVYQVPIAKTESWDERRVGGWCEIAARERRIVDCYKTLRSSVVKAVGEDTFVCVTVILLIVAMNRVLKCPMNLNIVTRTCDSITPWTILKSQKRPNRYKFAIRNLHAKLRVICIFIKLQH